MALWASFFSSGVLEIYLKVVLISEVLFPVHVPSEAEKADANLYTESTRKFMAQRVGPKTAGVHVCLYMYVCVCALVCVRVCLCVCVCVLIWFVGHKERRVIFVLNEPLCTTTR